MKHTTHRLTTAQQRRQWISGPLFLAGSAYLLHLVLSRPLNERTALVGILFVPLLAVIGTAHLLALRTSVSFDGHELWWTPLWGGRKRVAWTDVTNAEVVKKNERANAPDVVRITHRVHGVRTLPVLIGLPGTWRDPDFEAKAAGLVTAWHTATAAATPAAAT
ncbi:hypothetical protein GCM10018790_69970 [Kitasatospora xanthocidica]|uniref:hypothetical protein n=1 Tax=Kitasatospora xanthocidica TaxID=83382 RepID=UPI0016752720|nr:hypothetical protein [Kitasatospora xanthocidica]GHF82241.1 hypothetical protein GCM10018790_69970 [Kitasatospora xanthocidica]